MRSEIAYKLSRLLATLAVLLLVLSPSLDSAANAATQAVKAGDNSFMTRAISSFDVVDDVLDHYPGAHHSSLDGRIGRVAVGTVTV